MTLSPRLALTLLLLATHPSRAADPPSLTLTTDTAAYCTQLAHQIETRHSPNLEVQRLLTEGRELCDHGQTRVGIRRLRRAHVMLHHHTPHEDAPQ
jgi:hypothetical protein